MSFEIRLIVDREGIRWLEHVLDRSPITIGRASTNDVVLAEPTVSHQHAQVTVTRGRLLLRDTSSNGTFVDGERVIERSLDDNEVVQIPPFALRLSLHQTAPRGTLLREQTPLPPAPRLSAERTAEFAARPSPEPEAGPNPEPGPGTGPEPAPGTAGEASDEAPTVDLLPVEGTPQEGTPQEELGPATGSVSALDSIESAATPVAVDLERPEAGIQDPDADQPASHDSEGPDPRDREAADANQGTAVGPAAEATLHPHAHGPVLEVVEGPSNLRGRRTTIDSEAVLIGRGAEADIRYEAATVSRRHARLARHASGGWRIEDLGSANGTFVDGQRVVSARLGASHRVRFGTEVMTRFRLPASSRDTLPIETGELEVDLVRPPGSAGVLVMHVGGRVDRYSYSQLGRRLQGLIDSGEHRLVLDLEGVAFIDHTGLGVLVSAATAIDRAGGRLRLVGVGEPLRRALSLSRLDMFFRGRIARDLESAVRALEGPLSPASRQPAR